MVKLRQRLWPSVNNLSLVEFNNNLSPIQTTLNNQNIKTIFFFNLSITFKEVALPGNFFFLNGYMCIRKFFYYRFLFAHMDCSSFFLKIYNARFLICKLNAMKIYSYYGARIASIQKIQQIHWLKHIKYMYSFQNIEQMAT